MHTTKRSEVVSIAKRGYVEKIKTKELTGPGACLLHSWSSFRRPKYTITVQVQNNVVISLLY